MFDLPVKTALQRRNATGFRKFLVELGFHMAQLSVYVKYLPSSGRLLSLGRSIKKMVPPGGLVQIVTITDRQWSNSVRYVNQNPVETEPKPEQLTIF
nr:CRISPR-associated endonuclease Cas2 [Boudabousia marimammalium]